MSSESIPESLEGERLDRVVAFVLDISRNRAGNLIDDGKVTLNGKVEQARSRRVQLGEILSVSQEEREDDDAPEPEENIAIPVVYEDEEVLVVDKPAGLVVHPGAGNMTGTMINGLLASWPDLRGIGSKSRPGIVHRLDRGTSGLLVVARTQKAYDHLSAQLSDRSMGRWYTALVWGLMDSDTGSVDAPIGRSKKDRIRMAVISAGRPAKTNYEVTQRWSDPIVSLIRCKLETGRTHQIRVHLSAIGHPLVGDELYGGKRNVIELERPFLHASFLEFEHPARNERVSFESQIPSDLKDVLKDLSD